MTKQIEVPTGRAEALLLIERVIDEHRLSGTLDLISEVLCKKCIELGAVHGDECLSVEYRDLARKVLSLSREAETDLGD